MREVHVLVSGVLVLLLSACGSPDQASEPEAGSAPAAEEPVAKKEGVFDPMVGTIDKAKGIEGAASSRKDEMDRAVDGD